MDLKFGPRVLWMDQEFRGWTTTLDHEFLDGPQVWTTSFRDGPRVSWMDQECGWTMSFWMDLEFGPRVLWMDHEFQGWTTKLDHEFLDGPQVWTTSFVDGPRVSGIDQEFCGWTTSFVDGPRVSWMDHEFGP